MTEDGRMALVARFRNELSYCDVVNFQVGQMCDIRDMLYLSFQGLPTFCWHEVRMLTCCDGVASYGTHRQIFSVQPSGVSRNQQSVTIEAQLQRRFGDKVVYGGDRCSSGEGCTLQKRQRRLVVDRLPPVIRFEYYEDITSHESIQTFKPFENIAITYNTTESQGGGVDIKYKCDGVIFLVGGDHFIARWKISRSEFVEYDGMRSGGRAQRSGTSFVGGSARNGAVLIIATFFVIAH